MSNKQIDREIEKTTLISIINSFKPTFFFFENEISFLFTSFPHIKLKPHNLKTTCQK